VTHFKLDENLPADLHDLLRTAGHEAATAHEQGLSGAPDTRVAEVCRSEGRVLLTLDLDFADLRAYPPEEHAGLIVLRLSHQDKHSVAHVVRQILPLIETEPLAGHLWVVDEHSVRIRGGLAETD
jgi:predicted nuclease of predicted toxin-antitoxin system